MEVKSAHGSQGEALKLSTLSGPSEARCAVLARTNTPSASN
jgi:hypothetical protein